MKFLHTADWQIGMRAAHVGARAVDVRRARLETAERVVTMARTLGADAMLVAGDTFEDNAVQSADVQRVADILAAFGGPVYVIPGNHDPAVAASLWQHPAWRRDGLHVLLKPEPLVVGPGVTLYPCPLESKSSRSDPTAWIAAAGGDGVRVGLAHGTVQGAAVVEDVFPIARDAATRGGLDFLALGHWHSTASFDSARMAYAGTPETTKFGERDSGNVLLVEVAGRRVPPRVEKIATGRLHWLDVVRDIRSDGDLLAVIAEIEAVAAPATSLLSLRLTGLLQPDALPHLQHLRDLLEARFPLFAELDDELIPEPADAAWVDRLPLGLMRMLAQRLLANAPAQPETARRALVQLYANAREQELLAS